MKKTITFFLLIFAVCLNAQNKIFFDKDWKETQEINAVYYRVVEPKGKLFYIKDYFIDGSKQYEGFLLLIKNHL